MSTTYHLRCMAPGGGARPHWGDFRAYVIDTVREALRHRAALVELQEHVPGFWVHITGVFDGDDDFDLSMWLLMHRDCPVEVYDEYGRPAP